MNQTIIFATTNKAKVQGLKDLTTDIPVTWMSFTDLDYTISEPEETGNDGAENAEIKAKFTMTT